jgi:3-oxoacyl-[acyl-carrier protein] reductase
MDLGIAGKVVFFTGGSKGMGRVAATMLAEEGCKVAIVARGKDAVDETVSAITAGGGTAIGVTADITKQDQVAAAVERVTRELGPPSIAVGQALYNQPGDFADITDPEVYVESFRAYTMSTIYLLKAVLPGMKGAGWGRFVHVGSATAKEPEGSIHHVVANATRPSTIGLLKTVADEYAQYGITVNTVAPGWIETENAIGYLNRQAGLVSAEARGRWMKEQARVPAARMGRPEEIASMIVYLCSELAGYVNGAWIEVDGAHHRSAF